MISPTMGTSCPHTTRVWNEAGTQGAELTYQILRVISNKHDKVGNEKCISHVSLMSSFRIRNNEKRPMKVDKVLLYKSNRFY